MWKQFNEKYLKTKRTQVWIEPKSQQRFIFDVVKHYILILALVFFFVYSFPFVTWFTDTSAFEHQVVFKDFLKINASKWPLLLAVLFIFVFYAIMISHKLFGPMFKLKQHLKALHEGEVQKELFFRQGDYFMDIVDPINEFQSQVEQSFTVIKGEVAKLPQNQENQGIIKAIEAELQKYKIN